VTAAARKIRARLLDMLRGANGGYDMGGLGTDWPTDPRRPALLAALGMEVTS
jgi:hypothetical protein